MNFDNSHYDDCNHECYRNRCCNIWFLPSIILFITAALFSLISFILFLVGIVFPPASTANLTGDEIQLQTSAQVTIANGSPIIFDTTINDQLNNISYNPITGTVSITASGTYYVNWWISADGSTINPTIDFALVTSTGKTITASTPALTDQFSGNALLTVTATPSSPVTFQIVNKTGNDVFLGATTVKADLTIINAE